MIKKAGIIMLNECTIEKIKMKDVKVLIAAIEYYAMGIENEHKKKMIKLRKTDALVNELRVLKAKIEKSKTDRGVTVKEYITLEEEKEYKNLIELGKTEEELQGKFLYQDCFGM